MKATISPDAIRQIRIWLSLFVFFLIISGLTAFPLETELQFLCTHKNLFPLQVQHWLQLILSSLEQTNAHYPWMAYGTDWLAFAHLVIAVAFYGPIKDPIQNQWVIRFGIIACLMVFPLALIAGPVRHIPFYWRLIDCSFGLIGILPLWHCLNLLKKHTNPSTLH